MAQIFYIGWRTHDGDDRPIEADVYVEVRDERGETWRGQAGLFRWNTYPGLPNIVAYRPIED